MPSGHHPAKRLNMQFSQATLLVLPVQYQQRKQHAGRHETEANKLA